MNLLRTALALIGLVLLPAALDAGGDTIALGKTEVPPLILELRLETQVEGRFTTLRELMTVVTDHDEVWSLVGDTRIRVREGGFVRRADVSRRLGRAGLSSARFSVTGPAFCTCDTLPSTGVSR